MMTSGMHRRPFEGRYLVKYLNAFVVQEEIKAVFDGSCQLIPLQEVAKECKQLADDFIPELIETLSSQMNPQVVCATAGLCNSVRVDRLLREQGMDHHVSKLHFLPKKNCFIFSTSAREKNYINV